MNAKIISEIRLFLERYRLSARKLAIEAGVTPVIVTRVLSGERQDMLSSNADALRDAMTRLSLTTSPRTPTEPEEVNHELA